MSLVSDLLRGLTPHQLAIVQNYDGKILTVGYLNSEGGSCNCCEYTQNVRVLKIIDVKVEDHQVSIEQWEYPL